MSTGLLTIQIDSGVGAGGSGPGTHLEALRGRARGAKDEAAQQTAPDNGGHT